MIIAYELQLKLELDIKSNEIRKLWLIESDKLYLVLRDKMRFTFLNAQHKKSDKDALKRVIVQLALPKRTKHLEN